MFKPVSRLRSLVAATALVLSIFAVPVLAGPPDEPLVVPLDGPGQSLGRRGGSIDMLFSRAKDIRFLGVYGYARLVGFDAKLAIVPDILKDLRVHESREFTLQLRKGHKWSDGQPFTAEDFRYYFEDMVLNETFAEDGPPTELLVDGKLPKFEVLDETTVRYTWEKPHPTFLMKLASASPFYLYRPAHYLKVFHEKYTEPSKLDEMVAEAEKRNWRALHFSKDRQYQNDNPELPTLDPWINATPSTSTERFIFKRNDYFHRVDAAGTQLPYVDEIVVTIASAGLIPAKVQAGEADLQARNLEFKNYTVLKRAAARSGYTVNLWITGKGSQLALYPNLNVKDEVWRTLLRDVRFRRAMSLAINRREINQVLFYGLGKEAGNTVLPSCELYVPALNEKWTSYDPDAASRLLDEIGLTYRDSGGIRSLPDGRPLEIIVETAGEDTNETDILELIKDTWREAGIRLFIKASRREVLRDRAASGATLMSTWFGLDNGMPTADFPPFELAPSGDDQLHWPQWGRFRMTAGKSGTAPDDPAAQRLSDLYDAWEKAADTATRKSIWQEMLAIQADQVFTIGTVSAVPQPVIATSKLRNVPEKGFYNWDPGAYFGMYRPDTFWLDTGSGS